MQKQAATMTNYQVLLLYAIALVAMSAPIVVESSLTNCFQCSKLTDEELLAKLGEKELSARTVKKLLKSIEHKTSVVIGGRTVESLLDMAKRRVVMDVSGCESILIEKKFKDLKDSDLTLLLNVYNFVNNHDEFTRKRCAELIVKMFKFRLHAELDEKSLTFEEMRDLFSRVKDKKSVRIDEMSLQEIVEAANKPSPSLEDCQYFNLRARRLSNAGRNLATGGKFLISNIHQFIRYDQFVSFCAENFKQVYEKYVSVDDKRLIRKYYEMKVDPEYWLDKKERVLKFRNDHSMQVRCWGTLYRHSLRELYRGCKSASCRSYLQQVKIELEELYRKCNLQELSLGKFK